MRRQLLSTSFRNRLITLFAIPLAAVGLLVASVQPAHAAGSVTFTLEASTNSPQPNANFTVNVFVTTNTATNVFAVQVPLTFTNATNQGYSPNPGAFTGLNNAFVNTSTALEIGATYAGGSSGSGKVRIGTINLKAGSTPGQTIGVTFGSVIAQDPNIESMGTSANSATYTIASPPSTPPPSTPPPPPSGGGSPNPTPPSSPGGGTTPPSNSSGGSSQSGGTPNGNTTVTVSNPDPQSISQEEYDALQADAVSQVDAASAEGSTVSSTLASGKSLTTWIMALLGLLVLGAGGAFAIVLRKKRKASLAFFGVDKHQHGGIAPNPTVVTPENNPASPQNQQQSNYPGFVYTPQNDDKKPK